MPMRVRDLGLANSFCRKASPLMSWYGTASGIGSYQLFKSRLVQSAQAALAGAPVDNARIEIIEDIYDPANGGREFGIRDLYGYALYFMQ